MSNEVWLKTLKKGSKVAIFSGHYVENWHTETVHNVTPTGRIVTIDDKGMKTTFNEYGRKHTGERWDSGKHLGPVTKEMLDERVRKNLIFKISNFDLNNLGLEDAKKVYTLFTDLNLKQKP